VEAHQRSARTGYTDTLLTLVTLTLTRWPWLTSSSYVFWSCTCVPKVNFPCQGLRTDRQINTRRCDWKSLPRRIRGRLKCILSSYVARKPEMPLWVQLINISVPRQSTAWKDSSSKRSVTCRVSRWKWPPPSLISNILTHGRAHN